MHSRQVDTNAKCQASRKSASDSGGIYVDSVVSYPSNPPRRRYSPFVMTDKSVRLILPSQIAFHDLSICLGYDEPVTMVSVIFLYEKRPLTVHKTFQIIIEDSGNLSDGEPSIRTSRSATQTAVKQEELEISLVSMSLVIQLNY